MTEPIDPTPSPAAMPAHLPGAEPEPQDERPPRTLEWYEEEVRKLRKESANYRTKYREAATDLEAAASQLGAMRHAEIERLAAEHLKDPSDVWRAQADPSAFLDEEFGTVDPAKVTEVAQSLVTEKPHYAADKRVAPPPTNRPIEGLRGGATPGDYTGTPEPTWADVIPKPVGRMSAGG
jgi:hypothetical protein